jgi:hypothetical protein
MRIILQPKWSLLAAVRRADRSDCARRRGVETAVVAMPPAPRQPHDGAARELGHGARRWASGSAARTGGAAADDAASSTIRRGCSRAGGLFEAGEIGLAAFGYNIENRHLLAALEGAPATFRRSHDRRQAETFDRCGCHGPLGKGGR